MSDFEIMASKADANMSDIAMESQVEIIWQMGLASLSSNNNELILPQAMTSHLTEASIEDLKSKLSRHIGAPTIAFLDEEAQLFRICRVPSLVQTGDSPGSFSSPQASSDPRSSATPGPDPKPAGKSGSRGGKAEVRRPPNAFILYRTDRHPIIKQADPSLHNNDISRKVGKEWKQVPGAVHAAYKARAERIKRQHAIDNPGYQYAPRKPGDKKRRMTKKKLARMRSGNSANDVADHVRSDADGNLPSDLDSEDDMPKRVKTTMPATAEDYMGTRRSPHVSQLALTDDMNVQVTLPSNNEDIVAQAQNYQNLSGAVLPFRTDSGTGVVSTSVPQHVQNDDDFVNSLVDWEGLAEDMALIQDGITDDLGELTGLDVEAVGVEFAEEHLRKAYEKEVQRIMKWI